VTLLPCPRTTLTCTIRGEVQERLRWPTHGTYTSKIFVSGGSNILRGCSSGMAGGNKPSQGRGGEAKFHAVPWAQQGDLGSKVLKKGPATANYTVGSVVEMSWAIRYNHGGGCAFAVSWRAFV
jgi:hypothetical protein